MRVAIIITASSYTGELGRLAASAKDSDAIETIVKHRDRFGEILSIHDEGDSAVLNEKLYNFIKRFENTEVDEILFYFSGHGEFHEDEFYYLLPDYRTSRRRQTSIINSELDNAIRSIRPNLYVKIVDACHSGISYIKDANHIRGFLEKPKPEFKDLYFLFSSQAEEFSWQGKKLSAFTSALVGSVVDHTQPTIKYRDVINYISDEFETTASQKPFFINQGSYTDIFCDVDDDLKSLLRSIYTSKSDDMQKSEPKGISLYDLVAAEAEAYCDEDEALEILRSLRDGLTAIRLDAEFKNLFEVMASDASVDELPQKEDIGIWLSRQNDQKYFAKPTHTTEVYQKRVPKNTLLALTGSLAPLGTAMSEENYKYVSETRTVVAGFKSTTTLPYDVVFLDAINELPNLNECGCYIVPILSRTHIRLFYTFCQWEPVDWKSKRRVGKTEWQSVEAPLKKSEAIGDMILQIQSAFAAFVQDPIKAKFFGEAGN